MIRFIHISDTHIGPSKEFLLQGVNTYYPFQTVLKAIQNLPFRPDFIVHTGDIVADPDEKSYALFADTVKDISIPIYYVSGNHDDSQMIMSGLHIGEREQLMGNRLVYRFDFSGHQFLVLDGQGPKEIDPHGTISEEQFEVIDSQLTNVQSPLTIFIHFPLLPIDCTWVDAKMLLLQGEKLHALFVKHREKICGVFHGHIHRGTQLSEDGIRYQSVGSTCVQFGVMPFQEAPTFENHGRGYFNIVTIEGGSIIVREDSVVLQNS